MAGIGAMDRPSLRPVRHGWVLVVRDALCIPRVLSRHENRPRQPHPARPFKLGRVDAVTRGDDLSAASTSASVGIGISFLVEGTAPHHACSRIPRATETCPSRSARSAQRSRSAAKACAMCCAHFEKPSRPWSCFTISAPRSKSCCVYGCDTINSPGSYCVRSP